MASIVGLPSIHWWFRILISSHRDAQRLYIKGSSSQIDNVDKPDLAKFPLYAYSSPIETILEVRRASSHPSDLAELSNSQATCSSSHLVGFTPSKLLNHPSASTSSSKRNHQNSTPEKISLEMRILCHIKRLNRMSSKQRNDSMLYPLHSANFIYSDCRWSWLIWRTNKSRNARAMQ